MSSNGEPPVDAEVLFLECRDVSRRTICVLCKPVISVHMASNLTPSGQQYLLVNTWCAEWWQLKRKPISSNAFALVECNYQNIGIRSAVLLERRNYLFRLLLSRKRRILLFESHGLGLELGSHG